MTQTGTTACACDPNSAELDTHMGNTLKPLSRGMLPSVPHGMPAVADSCLPVTWLPSRFQNIYQGPLCVGDCSQ